MTRTVWAKYFHTRCPHKPSDQKETFKANWAGMIHLLGSCLSRPARNLSYTGGGRGRSGSLSLSFGRSQSFGSLRISSSPPRPFSSILNSEVPYELIISVYWACNNKVILNELMVFTVTSSDCRVKKAWFYEFLFTLGWRLIGNKSLYKFPAPKHVSFRKYSSLNFRVFTVRDTKIGMLSPWKKSLRLIFSILTISSIRRYVYAQIC